MNERDAHPHELISAMLDGEIDGRERAAVDAHLRECAECRDLAGDLAALGEVLAEDPVPPVPAGLASRISWRLRSRDVPRRRVAGVRLPGPRVLAAAGGIAAAVLVAVVLVREPRAPFATLDARARRSAEVPRDLDGTARAGEVSGTGAAAPRSDRQPSREEEDSLEKLQALGYVDTEGKVLGGESVCAEPPSPGRGAAASGRRAAAPGCWVSRSASEDGRRIRLRSDLPSTGTGGAGTGRDRRRWAGRRGVCGSAWHGPALWRRRSPPRRLRAMG